MGSIFFHEVAHLIGVPHSNPQEKINVPNCVCSGKSVSLNNTETLMPNLNSIHRELTRLNLSIEKTNNENENIERSTRTHKVSDGCLRIP